jgi:hypothetical protein
MSSPVLSFPLGFSRLPPAFQPSAEEIATYATLIAAKEGLGAEHAHEFRREAELQLWVWRSEKRRQPASRRRGRGPAAT